MQTGPVQGQTTQRWAAPRPQTTGLTLVFLQMVKELRTAMKQLADYVQAVHMDHVLAATQAPFNRLRLAPASRPRHAPCSRIFWSLVATRSRFRDLVYRPPRCGVREK